MKEICNLTYTRVQVTSLLDIFVQDFMKRLPQPLYFTPFLETD